MKNYVLAKSVHCLQQRVFIVNFVLLYIFCNLLFILDLQQVFKPNKACESCSKYTNIEKIIIDIKTEFG